MCPPNLVSFSKDFRKQFYSREKPARDNINGILKELDGLLKYATKNHLPFRKIKLSLKIEQTNETLEVLITSKPRIIIKRIS